MSLKPNFEIKAWIYYAAVASTLACVAYYFAVFIYIATSRMGYAFSLEWLEGESYMLVHRALTGQLLYVQPSYEYVPVHYPPFYYYVSAVVARVIGFSFLPLRLVSFVSTLGCMATIYLICRREGTGLIPAFTASGLFAATYGLSGFWFDIGRVDMLSVFLILLAVYILRFQSVASYIWAGLIFSVACLTKQTHLIALACLCVYLVLVEREKSLAFTLPAFGSLALSYVLLNRLHSGWFGFFSFGLAAKSGEYVALPSAAVLQTAADFWLNSIILALPIVVLFISAYCVIVLRERDNIKRLFFYAACATGMIGTSWSVVQVGGYLNDLIPAYAAITILFGLSLQKIWYEHRSNWTYQVVLFAVCSLQFVMLHYSISVQIPTQEDQLAGQALVAEIKQQPGDVYIPFHPELSLMAGKPSFASYSTLSLLDGIFGGGDALETRRVKTEFANAMQRQQFSMIILDRDLNWVWGHPEKYYYLSKDPVFSDPDVFWPVVGWQNRPTIIMFPIQ